jgi:uncharacterized integral membrane protein
MIFALIKLLLTAAIILLGIALGLYNTTPIAIQFLSYSTPELPFFVWLLLALLLGIVLSSVLSSWRIFWFKRQQKKIQSARTP